MKTYEANEGMNGLGALFGPDGIEVEARRLIGGARRDEYGDVRLSFARIAQVWSGIMAKKVTPEDVALCMAGLKLVREASKAKRDNRVDAVGYMLLLDQLQDEEAA